MQSRSSLLLLSYFISLLALASGCQEDSQTCEDGSPVFRDPNNNCQFFPCPASADEDKTNRTLSGPHLCTDDLAQCSDDTWVARDISKNCIFSPCPDGGDLVACSDETALCGDGSSVGRDPSDGCNFKPCPNDVDFRNNNHNISWIGCTEDARECPDGSWVGRDASNNCQFFPCPASADEDKTNRTLSGPHLCTDDLAQCSDDTWVARDISKNCDFFPCPDGGDLVACSDETALCGDGSSVGRDPSDGCNFKPCPNDEDLRRPVTEEWPIAERHNVEGDVVCKEDLAQCLDGSWVGREVSLGCEFACPNDGDLIGCSEDARECADGSWVGRDVRANCEFAQCPESKSSQGQITLVLVIALPACAVAFAVVAAYLLRRPTAPPESVTVSTAQTSIKGFADVCIEIPAPSTAQAMQPSRPLTIVTAPSAEMA